MFKILQKTFRTGIVTAAYPKTPARVPEHFRGRPEFDFERWRDARPAAEACPTGAIAVRDRRRFAAGHGRLRALRLLRPVRRRLSRWRRAHDQGIRTRDATGPS